MNPERLLADIKARLRLWGLEEDDSLWLLERCEQLTSALRGLGYTCDGQGLLYRNGDGDAD